MTRCTENFARPDMAHAVPSVPNMAHHPIIAKVAAPWMALTQPLCKDDSNIRAAHRRHAHATCQSVLFSYRIDASHRCLALMIWSCPWGHIEELDRDLSSQTSACVARHECNKFMLRGIAMQATLWSRPWHDMDRQEDHHLNIGCWLSILCQMRPAEWSQVHRLAEAPASTQRTACQCPCTSIPTPWSAPIWPGHKMQQYSFTDCCIQHIMTADSRKSQLVEIGQEAASP